MIDLETEGSFVEGRFPEVVLAIGKAARTGMLRAERDGIIKVVYFRDGEISFASSNEDADRLGHVFIRAGKLTEEQLAVAMERMDATTSLGKTFISLGYITPKELLWGARRQVEDILLSLCRWRDGRYQFIEGPVPKKIANLRLPTAQVVARTLQEIPDRDWVLERLGSLDTVFSTRRGAFDEIKALELGSEVEAIAAKVDGTRSIRDICSLAKMDDFAVSKLLYALYLLGMLEIERTSEEEEQAMAVEGEQDPMGLGSLSDDMNFADLFAEEEPRSGSRGAETMRTSATRTTGALATADTVAFSIDEAPPDAGTETMTISPAEAAALRARAAAMTNIPSDADTVVIEAFTPPVAEPEPEPPAMENEVAGTTPETAEAEPEEAETSFRDLFMPEPGDDAAGAGGPSQETDVFAAALAEARAADARPASEGFAETDEFRTPDDEATTVGGLMAEPADMASTVDEEEGVPIFDSDEPETRSEETEVSPSMEVGAKESDEDVEIDFGLGSGGSRSLAEAVASSVDDDEATLIREPPRPTPAMPAPPPPLPASLAPPPMPDLAPIKPAPAMPAPAATPSTPASRESDFAALFRDEAKPPLPDALKPAPKPSAPARPPAPRPAPPRPRPAAKSGGSGKLIAAAIVIPLLVGIVVAYLNWELIRPMLPAQIASMLGGEATPTEAPTRRPSPGDPDYVPVHTIKGAKGTTTVEVPEATPTDAAPPETAETPTASPSPTSRPTPSPSPTPTARATPSPSPSPTPRASPSPSPSPTVRATPSPSPSPTATPREVPTVTGDPLASGRTLATQGRYAEAATVFAKSVAATTSAKFSVQLELDCQESSLRDALQHAGGSPKVFFVPKAMKGRSCYMVLWGLFPTEEAASREMEAIPPALIEGGARPRVVRTSTIGP